MPTRAAAIASLTGHGETYELVDVDIDAVRCRAFANAPANLRALYDDARSDAAFYSFGDETYTFEDAWCRSARIARVLHDHYGVRAGDRVAISMRNYPEWIFSFMAATSIGAIAVGMNALWTAEEHEYAIETTNPTVLLVDQERYERLTHLHLPATRILAIRTGGRVGPNVRRLEDLLDDVPAVMPPASIESDDDAVILFTSGSTGHPKGVVSTHRAVLTALLSWELDERARAMEDEHSSSGRKIAGPAPQATWLLTVPLFHVSGLHVFILSAFRAQKRVIGMYRWDVEKAAALIERERVNVVIAAPAITGDLVNHGRKTGRDMSSLQVVGGGGAARAPEQVRAIDEVLEASPNIGWGMTETNAIGTGISGADYLARPTSSGRCSAVLELRVVDEYDNALPTGSRGELQVRGTAMFREYWNQAEANASSFAPDRWFRTGDVAMIDDDGFLYIVDRVKDLVIRGGENIGCGTVEAALVEYPGVHEASVYAVPDARLGEEVAATVYADAGVDEDALRAFLQQRLAHFELPRYIEITTEPLPRVASGKTFRRQLQAAAIDRLRSSVSSAER